MHRKITLLALILFILPGVIAGNYTNVGADDFLLERGTFNSATDPLTDVSIVSKSLTDSKLTPLVGDLDNDGTNEIVVLDDDDIRIYQGNTLTVIDSFDYGDSSINLVGNMILYDIDGDEFLEIVFPMEQIEQIAVLGFNGTIQNESYIDLTGLSNHDSSNLNSGEMVLNCRDTNECLLVYGRRKFDVTATSNGLISARGFNSTDLTTNTITLETTSSVISQTACLPKIRHIEVADLENDGSSEYVFNYMHYLGAGNDADTYTLYAIEQSGNTISTKSGFPVDDTSASGVNDPSGTVGCSGGEQVGQYFSPPISFNIDPNSPTQLEIMYARMNDVDQYDILDYNSDGSLLDTHPAGIDSGAGSLISNVFKATAIPNSDEYDICVIGFDDNAGEITMVCGSKSRSSGTFESFEYSVDVTGITPNYNVTQTYLNMNVISHATQQSNALTDGVDLTEVLNTYGVFRADFDTCDLLANCDMELLFLNGCGDSVNLAVDVENIDSTDLICMTDIQLTYIDDLLSNQPATITTATFDPCVIDSVVKVNETLKVSVTVTDGSQGSIETDLVNQIVTGYNDNPNQVVSTLENVSSGSLNTHFIFLNSTVTNGEIKIQGFDNGNPSTIDEITQAFTVGANGLSQGDSSCSLTLVTTESGESSLVASGLRETNDNNTVTQLTNQVSDIWGLGGDVVWIILMVIGSMVILGLPMFGENPREVGTIFTQGRHPFESSTTMVLTGFGIVIFNIGMLFLGFKIGTIGIGTILILVVLASLPIGLLIRKMIVPTA